MISWPLLGGCSMQSDRKARNQLKAEQLRRDWSQKSKPHISWFESTCLYCIIPVPYCSHIIIPVFKIYCRSGMILGPSYFETNPKHLLGDISPWYPLFSAHFEVVFKHRSLETLEIPWIRFWVLGLLGYSLVPYLYINFNHLPIPTFITNWLVVTWILCSPIQLGMDNSSQLTNSL